MINNTFTVTQTFQDIHGIEYTNAVFYIDNVYYRTESNTYANISSDFELAETKNNSRHLTYKAYFWKDEEAKLANKVPRALAFSGTGLAMGETLTVPSSVVDLIEDTSLENLVLVAKTHLLNTAIPQLGG